LLYDIIIIIIRGTGNYKNKLVRLLAMREREDTE